VTAAPAVASPFAGKFELVPLFSVGKPVLKNGHTDYAVRNDLVFRTAAGDHVTVFAGQVTDLASIPRAVWPLLPPDGPWALAAVFHDAGYRSCGTYRWPHRLGRTRSAPYSRAEVDDILLQAMTALDVPAWKRRLIWSAVRLFGGGGWSH
jgi:hypothetical protein